MSITNYNNLFAYNRNLPRPFDTIDKKVDVSSTYGNGTYATMSPSVIKGINAVCACFSNKNEGAVGTVDEFSVAEYKSSEGPDLFHLFVYNKLNGSVIASVYDRNIDVFSAYVLNARQRDGAALMMVLFPTFMQDKEFHDNFEAYYAQYICDFEDFNVAKETMAIMCDNVYRRIKDPGNPKHINLEVDVSGNLLMVTRSNLKAKTYEPKIVTAGEFKIFSETSDTKKVTAKSVDPSDFVGKYAFEERNFTVEEEMLIPKLPEWYIIPQEVVTICNHAKASTGRPTQMRNFLLRGCAGSGKTMGAKAIAAGLHLPYVKYTCSAGTEIFDFIGQVFPVTKKETDVVGTSAERDLVGLASQLGLPQPDEIEYAPDKAYFKLTGKAKEDATPQDCIAAIMHKVLSEPTLFGIEDSGTHHQDFIYTETDFIKALKNGYVVEIQEPTTIMQPGVLVGLNSLLEQDGTILLPTGELIHRHPDAVVVVTTNIAYQGCREMNQSVTDRMNLVLDVNLPPPEVMAQRAMSVTGATDEYQVMQMVNVVNDIAEYCRKNSITDGTVGMRSLIDWIISSDIMGDVYKAALHTIISKATSDEEERAAIVTTVLEPIFAPKSRI